MAFGCQLLAGGTIGLAIGWEVLQTWLEATMFHVDGKMILVGALFLAFVLVKLFAGGRPFDAPVRRPRRFGFRGSLSPLNQPGARDRPAPAEPQKTAAELEDEFFKGV